jgi:hypothetical protein
LPDAKTLTLGPTTGSQAEPSTLAMLELRVEMA